MIQSASAKPPASPAPSATLNAREAAGRVWDTAVVGAGPAGAMAAYILARRGHRVLLVDKASFPRGKVCGCCVGPPALDVLAHVGLGNLPHQLGAVPLRALRLGIGGTSATLALDTGVSLSRTALDAALVRHAIGAGVAFLPDTSVVMGQIHGSARHLHLKRSRAEAVVEARVVLAATGVRSLPGEPMSHLAPNPRGGLDGGRPSFIGMGATSDDAPEAYAPGTIHMACGGPAGYVGLVRLEDGRLNIAAAADPKAVRRCGGPGRFAARIVHEAGFEPLPDLERLDWHGTPRLTHRHDQLGTRRVLILGDAAGYVEPFTGEGIGWALASAVAAAPIAEQAMDQWSDGLVSQWTRRYRALLGRRQRACSLLTGLLRHAPSTGAAIGLLDHLPVLAQPLVRLLHRPFALQAFIHDTNFSPTGASA